MKEGKASVASCLLIFYKVFQAKKKLESLLVSFWPFETSEGTNFARISEDIYDHQLASLASFSFCVTFDHR